MTSPRRSGLRMGTAFTDPRRRAPLERHRQVLSQLLTATSVRANLVPDAHLAALAIEHGLVLASTDGDFARFPGLRFENPLAGPTDS